MRLEEDEVKAPTPKDKQMISLFLTLGVLTLIAVLLLKWALIGPVTSADLIEMATK